MRWIFVPFPIIRHSDSLSRHGEQRFAGAEKITESEETGELKSVLSRGRDVPGLFHRERMLW